MKESSLENRGTLLPSLLPVCPSSHHVEPKKPLWTSALGGGPGMAGSSATPAGTATGEGAKAHSRSQTVGLEGGLRFQLEFPWAFDLIFFNLPPRLPNSTAPTSAPPVHWEHGLAWCWFLGDSYCAHWGTSGPLDRKPGLCAPAGRWGLRDPDPDTVSDLTGEFRNPPLTRRPLQPLRDNVHSPEGSFTDTDAKSDSMLGLFL